MKTVLLTCYFMLALSAAFAQAPDEYNILVKRADSLYKAKEYKTAAVTYSAAFKTFGWKGYLPDRYTAACSWAMSGVPDSAFFNLERIASKADFLDYDSLVVDKDLLSLHSNKRWEPLLQTVLAYHSKLNKPLIRLLANLEQEDQKWRNYATRYNNHELRAGEDSISLKAVNRYCVLTDSNNYFVVQDIFRKYGFPNYDLVGEAGAANFWLLVQHQDSHPDFQDSVLMKMKVEVDAGKASAGNYAYLTDRVKVNTGQPQIYGTQMRLNADSTSFEPKKVIDPEKLNDRRASMGLGTIEEYIEGMNNRYSGTLKRR